jgi:hypothetical protein
VFGIDNLAYVVGDREIAAVLEIEPPEALPASNIDSRTHCEQSSIIFEHSSTLSECRSIFVDYVTIPKPSGLGMVSSFTSFKASAARVFLCVFSPIDACRI